MKNEDRPPGLAGDEDEGRVHVGTALVAGPDELRGVDLARREDAGQRGRSETVARRMFRRGLWASSERVEMPSKPM